MRCWWCGCKDEPRGEPLVESVVERALVRRLDHMRGAFHTLRAAYDGLRTQNEQFRFQIEWLMKQHPYRHVVLDMPDMPPEPEELK